MCPRTVCTLAHVFEAAGLSTVVITSMRGIANRMGVPRALHASFPLGRPLGKPRDKTFQSEVLRAALDLLTEPKGPVIRNFPISISSIEGEPLISRFSPKRSLNNYPASEEALSFKPVYDRTCLKTARTSVGKEISAEDIPHALQKFARIAEGESWEKLGYTVASMYCTSLDVRSYYEEVASEIAENPISPWATEQWFYEKTNAGRIILEARRAMRDNGVDKSVWFGLVPAGRE